MQAEGNTPKNSSPIAQIQNLQSSPNSGFRKLHFQDFQSPIETVSNSSQKLCLRSISHESQNVCLSSNGSNGSSGNRNCEEQEMVVKNIKSFKNIIEKDNEDSDYDCRECQFQDNEDCYGSQQGNAGEEIFDSPQNLDIFGNLLPICEFEVEDRFLDNDYEESSSFALQQIFEDKQNQVPQQCSSSMYVVCTPLKNKENSMRSPLRDITPTITKKKKKSAHTTQASEKGFLLTPRTLPLTESRRSGSGMRRMERL